MLPSDTIPPNIFQLSGVNSNNDGVTVTGDLGTWSLDFSIDTNSGYLAIVF